MPTYAFRCPKCGNEIQSIMKISEYVEGPRPKCCAEGCDGQPDMESIPLVGGGFSLKGTGWTPKFSNGASDGAPTDILIPKRR